MKKTPIIVLVLFLVLYVVKVLFFDKSTSHTDTAKTQINSSDTTEVGSEINSNPSLESIPLSPSQNSSDTNIPSGQPSVPTPDPLNSTENNSQQSNVDMGSAKSLDKGSIASGMDNQDKGSFIATDSNGKPKVDKGSHLDRGSYAEPGADLGSSFDNKGKGPDRGSALKVDQGSPTLDVGSQAAPATK